ncbi:MAG: hypothetical protein IPK88_07685 [Saprospiraceae bacterium]|nr:hypothetical protein [Candidatus Defluviibacterium haderslevense]
MTNITLAEYILSYNNDTLPHVKESRQITNSVIFKKVLGLPTPTTPNPQTYNYIYFILDPESRNCVSVVQLLEDDLHAFTSSNNRKKGFIKNAMVDAILPDRFKHNDSIEISLLNDDQSDYNISTKVAESLGFQKIGADEDKFVLLKKDFEVEILKNLNK